MAQQSVNLIVEQATIQQSRGILSLSNLSSIEYEADYSFLSESSFNGEHVQINNICLNPPANQYQIRFYELKSKKQSKKVPQSLTCETKGRQQQLEKHKIMSLYVKQEKKYQKLVRLPRSNNPIQVQIQSRNQRILKGKIKEDGQIGSSLYNQKGEKVATLQYDIKIANNKNNQQQFQEIDHDEENTLHSKDFQLSQNQNNSRVKELENEEKLEKNQEQFQNKLDKIEEQDEQKQKFTTTMSASSKVVRVIRRRKKYQNFEGNQSQIQQKGSQDYQVDLVQKVNNYQNPFEKKQIISVSRQKQVDFLSLKRSKQQLGLSQFNLEEIIYPKHLRSKPQLITQQPKKIMFSEKLRNPQTRLPTEPISESNRVNYRDYGVGTHTPLSAAKSSTKRNFNTVRQNVVKADVVRVHLKKLNTQKDENSPKYKNKKVFQDSDVRQSQDQYPIEKKADSEKKSKLKKFFLTNRQEQTKKLELDRINYQKLKIDQKKRQLSVDNKVLEIKVQEIFRAQTNIAPVVLDKMYLKDKKQSTKENKSLSCKDSLLINQSNFTALSDSELYPQYNLNINNISLNFRKKTFGSKMLIIRLNGMRHQTDKINGNNLMWAGRSYRLERINQNDEITIQVRGQSLEEEFTYGTVKIVFNDLLINKKQSFYQTFLLSDKQVLGIMILGYQILKKKDSLRGYIYPRKEQRKAHAQSEIKNIKETDKQEHQTRRKQYISSDVGPFKLPPPKLSVIKMKKYLGGKNIKIGKAHRFQDQGKLVKPGPADYEIDSGFSRHAFKQD